MDSDNFSDDDKEEGLFSNVSWASCEEFPVDYGHIENQDQEAVDENVNKSVSSAATNCLDPTEKDQCRVSESQYDNLFCSSYKNLDRQLSQREVSRLPYWTSEPAKPDTLRSKISHSAKPSSELNQLACEKIPQLIAKNEKIKVAERQDCDLTSKKDSDCSKDHYQIWSDLCALQKRKQSNIQSETCANLFKNSQNNCLTEFQAIPFDKPVSKTISEKVNQISDVDHSQLKSNVFKSNEQRYPLSAVGLNSLIVPNTAQTKEVTKLGSAKNLKPTKSSDKAAERKTLSPLSFCIQREIKELTENSKNPKHELYSIPAKPSALSNEFEDSGDKKHGISERNFLDYQYSRVKELEFKESVVEGSSRSRSKTADGQKGLAKDSIDATSLNMDSITLSESTCSDYGINGAVEFIESKVEASSGSGYKTADGQKGLAKDSIDAASLNMDSITLSESTCSDYGINGAPEFMESKVEATSGYKTAHGQKGPAKDLNDTASLNMDSITLPESTCSDNDNGAAAFIESEGKASSGSWFKPANGQKSIATDSLNMDSITFPKSTRSDNLIEQDSKGRCCSNENTDKQLEMFSIGYESSLNSTSNAVDLLNFGECLKKSDKIDFTVNHADNINYMPSQPPINSVVENLYRRTNEELFKEACFDVKNSKAFQSVLDVIDEHKIALLIGRSPRLMKAIGHSCLYDYQEQGKRVLSLSSVDEIPSIIDEQEKVVFLEEAFGQNMLNENKFHKGCDHLKKIFHNSEICGVILTLTPLCYNSCRNRLNQALALPNFHCIVVDSEKEFDNETRKEILWEIKNKFTENPESNRKQLSEPEINFLCKKQNPVFMECCDQFKTYSRFDNDNDIVQFFLQPMDILIKEVKCLREEWQDGYHILVLVALCPQFDIPQLMADYMKTIKQNFNLEYINICCKKLTDSYLHLQENKWQFLYEMVRNAVLFTVDDKEFLLANCPVSFITDISAMFFDKRVYRDQCISDTFYKELARRFVTEIQNGNCSKMAIHTIWNSPKFIEIFETECGSNLRKVIESSDSIHKENLLYWSIWNESDLFLHWILKMRKKFDMKDAKPIVNTIFAACINNDRKVLEYLHQRIKYKDFPTRKGGHLPLVKFKGPSHNDIFHSEFEVENQSKSYDNVFHTATANRSLDVLDYMHYKRLDINYADSQGYTSLHVACRTDVEIVKYFLKPDVYKEEHIIKTTKNKDTVLHEACSYGNNFETVRLLLERSPHLVNELNFHEQSALHKAVASGNVTLIELLEKTMTMVPTRYKHSHCTPLLRTDMDGNTVLHFACMKEDNLEMIKYLLQRFPILISYKNNEKNTAFHTACRILGTKTKVFEVLEVLLSKKADIINCQDSKLNTPLHLACEGNKRNLVKFLQENDAQIFRNSEHKYPCQLTKNKAIYELFSVEYR